MGADDHPSPAFLRDGLLIVTFDEADRARSPTPRPAATRQPGPAAALPGVTGPGGGRIGTVLVSPFIRPGTVERGSPTTTTPLLATIEDIFGLSKLGQAATVTSTFGRDVFSGYRAPGAA